MSFQIWIEILFQVVPFVFLLALGIFVGGRVERNHFKRLDRREDELRHIRLCNLKRVPDDPNIQQTQMVLGQVVIATDYFKTFATRLRMIVGGEAKSAERMMERARRESLIRMQEEAEQLGANEVWNIRFQTSNIYQMDPKKGRASMAVEVMAWGTAVTRGSDGSNSSDLSAQIGAGA